MGGRGSRRGKRFVLTNIAAILDDVAVDVLETLVAREVCILLADEVTFRRRC